jgi:hypothetical protein
MTKTKGGMFEKASMIIPRAMIAVKCHFKFHLIFCHSFVYTQEVAKSWDANLPREEHPVRKKSLFQDSFPPLSFAT